MSMSSLSPLQPPGPFSDFDLSFDPALSNLFPNPPSLPSSADLFSQDETLDLQAFFDNFGGVDWDTNTQEPPLHYDYPSNAHLPYTNPHLDTQPEPPKSSRSRRGTRSKASKPTRQPSSEIRIPSDTRESSSSRSTPSDSSSPVVQGDQLSSSTTTTTATRSKPLLSTPQKRLNHIMSEQKRRNAIRDGYSQLIALLAPAGSSHGLDMPTRGRPKGSGLRGKGQTKGKSGVLFRAVEYCRWLEEGRDALYAEVLRVETAAGIRHL